MIYLQIFMGLFILLFIMFIVMFFKNRKLKKEVKVLKELLALKDTTEASRVTVKDVTDDFSSHDEVMELVDAGESRESISKKLGIPANKIELIVKFDKIKKEKHV